VENRSQIICSILSLQAFTRATLSWLFNGLYCMCSLETNVTFKGYQSWISPSKSGAQTIPSVLSQAFRTKATPGCLTIRPPFDCRERIMTFKCSTFEHRFCRAKPRLSHRLDLSRRFQWDMFCQYFMPACGGEGKHDLHTLALLGVDFVNQSPESFLLLSTSSGVYGGIRLVGGERCLLHVAAEERGGQPVRCGVHCTPGRGAL
jgi:hypothetical protein